MFDFQEITSYTHTVEVTETIDGANTTEKDIYYWGNLQELMSGLESHYNLMPTSHGNFEWDMQGDENYAEITLIGTVEDEDDEWLEHEIVVAITIEKDEIEDDFADFDDDDATDLGLAA